jgi:hypothetical protein
MSLGLTGVAILLFYVARDASLAEWAKALIAALAFFFWAANQICTDTTIATDLNDIAIALFVLDVFLAIVGWKAASGTKVKWDPTGIPASSSRPGP